MMLFMVIAVSSVTFANNNPGEEDGYTLMTVAEIKAAYGEDAIQSMSEIELLDTDVIALSNNPCNGEQPCGGALASARAQTQRLANECCCVRFYGVICCQVTSGAIIAIDGIVVPNNCN